MKSGIYILTTETIHYPLLDMDKEKITGFVLFYHAHKPGHGISPWHIRKFTRCSLESVKDMASRLVLDTDEIRILTVEDTTK